MATATVTLATTTLSQTAEPGDSKIVLASTSGITPGVRLYVDRELLAVDRLTGIGNEAVVLRGIDGTAATRHASNTTVTIGRGDQFYTSDPIGLPPTVVPVSPYINVVTGVSWVAQGDEDGPGVAGRVWAPITVTMSAGALGARVLTTTTPS